MSEVLVKSNLLIFDKQDVNNNIFPKKCNITLPEKVPVYIDDAYTLIGLITSYNVSDSKIEIQAKINGFEEDLLKKIITDGNVYIAGWYKVNASHTEDGATIMDDLELLSAFITLNDVYGGSNDLKLEVINND